MEIKFIIPIERSSPEERSISFCLVTSSTLWSSDLTSLILSILIQITSVIVDQKTCYNKRNDWEYDFLILEKLFTAKIADFLVSPHSKEECERTNYCSEKYLINTQDSI